MKTTLIKKSALVVLFGLAILAGCGKKTEQEKPHYDAPPAASAPAKPAPAANSIVYYGQHLDEAKKTWHECRAKGAANLSDAEREVCANAQSAWEMQPYKAKK